jgi:hypothetical protein
MRATWETGEQEEKHREQGEAMNAETEEQGAL